MTTAAETSGANASHVIEVDSDEQLVHTIQLFVKDNDCNNEQLSKFLEDYFDNCNKTMNFYTAVVQQYLSNCQNGQGGFKGVNISHRHFFNDLDCVYTEHLLMCDTLRSFQNRLTRKLHCAKAWTKVLAVVLTVAVVVTSAAGAATAKTPAAMAAVAAVPTLLATFGGWALSLLRKYKDGVKKQNGITMVMLVGAKIIINDLSGLYLWARPFEVQTGSADDDEVRKKLQEHAAGICRDIRFTKEATLHSLIKHLE